MILYEHDLLLNQTDDSFPSPGLFFGDADSGLRESADDVLDLLLGGSTFIQFDYNSGSPVINFPSDNIVLAYNDGHRIVWDETYTSFKAGNSAAPNNAVSHTVAIGNFALDNITTSPGNLAIGTSALYGIIDDPTGYNLAIGSYCLATTPEWYNLGIGAFAGRFTTGYGNIVIGAYAGQGVNSQSTFNYSTFIGYRAGYSTTTANYNTFIGSFSGYYITTTEGNTGIGYAAFRWQTGAGNMSIGHESFFGVSGQTCDGDYNVHFGYQSGYYSVGADNNLGIGYQALKGNSGSYLTGGNNIGIGRAAGNLISSATFNLLIGNYAGDALTTGGQNIVIGHYCDVASDTDSKYFVLGYSTTHLLEGYMDTGNEYLTSPYRLGVGATPNSAYMLDVEYDSGDSHGLFVGYNSTISAWSDFPGSTIPAIAGAMFSISSGYGVSDGYNSIRIHARNDTGHNAYTILATEADTSGNHNTSFHLMLREGGGDFNTLLSVTHTSTTAYYTWKHDNSSADIIHRFMRNTTVSYVLGLDNTNGFQIHGSTAFHATLPDFCIMPTNNTVNIGGVVDSATYRFAVTGSSNFIGQNLVITNAGHALLDIQAASDTSTYDALVRFWSGATPSVNAIIGWDNGSNVLGIDFGSSFQTTHDVEFTDNAVAINVTLNINQYLEYDATPSSNTASGEIATFTAGAILSFGDVCYLNSSGQMVLADADSTTTSPAIAICLESLTSSQSGKFLLKGFIYNTGFPSITAGLEVYLSTTAGDITSTKPSGTGDVVQKLGISKGTYQLYFNPSMDWHTV